MTVYFVQRACDSSQVKIGHTDFLEDRMQALSAECDGGIELIAQCDGDRATEAAFHLLCNDARIQGEWFARSPEVERLIEAFKDGVKGRRVWGRLRAVSGAERSPLDVDRDLVHAELSKLMGRLGRIPVGHAITASHKILSDINPMWTLRRVRALWEKRGRRVDLYEMRDLRTANQLTDAEKAEKWADFADWILPEARDGEAA